MHEMKSVFNAAFLLTLALQSARGGVIGDYGSADSDEGHGGDIHGGFGQGEAYGPGQEYGQGENEILAREGHLGNPEAESAATGGGAAGVHESLVGQQISGEGGGYTAHQPQWQGGFSGSYGFGSKIDEASSGHSGAGHDFGGGGEQAYAQIDQGEDYGQTLHQEHEGTAYHSGIEVEGLEKHNIASLVAHGVQLGEHHVEQEHIDLHPKVEIQHQHIPTKTIERTKEVPVEVVKKIEVPVPHPVGVPTPQIIKIPVPQPYAVHISVPHPIAVPIYKLVPQEIEKKVPIEVEKLVPVYVDKPIKIEIEKHHVEYVDKPYPVHIPVYKHIFHHIPKHGHH